MRSIQADVRNLFWAALLSFCILTSNAVAAAEDESLQRDTMLALQGSDMSADQAADYEKRVVADSENIDSRIVLLGYYFSNTRRSPELSRKRLAHVLWMIEHSPRRRIMAIAYGQIDSITDPMAYAEAGKAWLKQVEANPNDATILGNAASYFTLSEPSKSEDLLKRAREADPKDSRFPQDLAHHYALGAPSRPGTARQMAYANALREMEAAYDLNQNEIERKSMLDSLAKYAIEAAELEKAERYARDFMAKVTPGDWNEGNAVHNGNSILGRVALAKGNVDEAKRYLLAAGATKGSPQLNSFGPNPSLAKELLERGERDVVVEYFKLCGTFWATGHDRLDRWTEVVKSGRIPDFGANLNY